LEKIDAEKAIERMLNPDDELIRRAWDALPSMFDIDMGTPEAFAEMIREIASAALGLPTKAGD
jgi:hypothetical protein